MADREDISQMQKEKVFHQEYFRKQTEMKTSERLLTEIVPLSASVIIVEPPIKMYSDSIAGMKLPEVIQRENTVREMTAPQMVVGACESLNDIKVSSYVLLKDGVVPNKVFVFNEVVYNIFDSYDIACVIAKDTDLTKFKISDKL